MKRAMRFFTRLYPSSWRARYGAELECLLEETKPSLRDAFDILWGAFKMQMTTWSFRRIMLVCAAAGILAATAISFAVPVHYQSHVTLMVMPASESGTLLVTNAAKSVFSSESLASIIRENNLYPRECAAMSLDDVIGKMRHNIRVIPVRAGSLDNREALAFLIQFDYPDAHIAQRVDGELTSSFLESALAARTHELAMQTIAPMPDSNLRFSVLDPPSLPQAPAGPNRTRFAAVGLLSGILCGVMLAIIARMRRNHAVRNA